MQNLADLCTPRRTNTSLSAAHTAKTGRLDQTTSERDLGLDGWMGFGDAASADAGEPHASQEAVRVRTGWRTQHMADTSARFEVKRLTQTSPGGGEVFDGAEPVVCSVVSYVLRVKFGEGLWARPARFCTHGF